MTATARLPRLITVLGRVSATLVLGWLAGCSESLTPAPAGTTAPSAAATPAESGSPVATTAPPAAPSAESRFAGFPVAYKGKADLEALVASLKGIGIEPVTTKGIDLRTFRFSGMADLLELSLTLDRHMNPTASKEPMEMVLTSDGVVKEGTMNLAILPPAATGKDGAKLVIQLVPDGPGGALTRVRDVPPLWYAKGAPRPRINSNLDSGAKFPIRRLRRPRALKLIAYSGPDTVEFRCRAVDPAESTVKPAAGDAKRTGNAEAAALDAQAGGPPRR